MSDPTKVYGGGIPMGGFNTEQKNCGLGISGEAESSETPGGPASRPGTVNQGGPTQAKTYDHAASANFLDDPSYNTVKPEGFQARDTFDLPMDIDNPDTISHADHTDDPDLPNK